MEKGAHFSLDRKYRYYLYRIWDKTKPCIQFIGLNPSIADETEDDPTIRRVVRFAQDWGYGGVFMTNLFAFCSTDAKVLKTCENPIGDNDRYLKEVSAICKGRVVFAWGNFKQATERAKVVSKMFSSPIALDVNKNGSPKHPLFVKADTLPFPYTMNL